MDLLSCCVAIGMHIASAHIDTYPNAPEMQNANPGLYVEFKNHVVLGVYRNSLGKDSAYVAYNLEFQRLGRVTPSLVLGGVTGYPAGRIIPMLLPSLRVPVATNTYVRLSYVPKLPATMAHVLHLSLEHRF